MHTVLDSCWCLALYQQYLAEREAFVPRYIKLLSYGGSAEPQAILAEAGLDISTPGILAGRFRRPAKQARAA